MTSNFLRAAVAGGAIAVLVVACSTVPVTGRKQLNFVPESEELALGEEAYAQVLKENKVEHERVVFEGVSHNLHAVKASEVNAKMEAWFKKYAKGK